MVDFKKHDMRGTAEAGVFCQLVDPHTGEPHLGEDGSRSGFMVRGVASPTAQSRLLEMQILEAKAEDDEGETEAALFEMVHQNQIKSALGYIISAENITIGDRVIDDEEGFREILNMSFPKMEVKISEGKPVMMEVQIPGPDGKPITVKTPQWEVNNNTYAMQVVKIAEDGERFLEQMRNA